MISTIPSQTPVIQTPLDQATIQPQLGLVCITTSPDVRFKTLTRKRLLAMSPAQQVEALTLLYDENLKRLRGAIDFCDRNHIRLYRLISNLFPFIDTDLGYPLLESRQDQLREIGERAQALGIRLVMHPDQFVVLNSDKPTVIQNSITVLLAHAQLFDWLGLPQSPWATINIHGGKGDRAERLIATIQDLPDSIRSRLTLENDEYTYSASAIAQICHAAGVAMVFDAHHHLVHEQLDSYDNASVEQALVLARDTWPDPQWQLVHISNGRDALHDPRHSDFIWDMPQSFRFAPWIEVEAKQKEHAVEQLRQSWLLMQAPA